MYTATFTYDSEIVIVHDGEDRDFAITPQGLLATIIPIPASEEWEPDVYDQALHDAGWRRTGEWTGYAVDATAPVEARSPLDEESFREVRTELGAGLGE